MEIRLPAFFEEVPKVDAKQTGPVPEGMRKHCILIAGDDEDITVSFGAMVGSMEHIDTANVTVPPDILDRICNGEIDTIIFCPHPTKTKKGAVKKVGDLITFVPERKE